MTDTEKHDPFAFGKAFAEFKKKTRPQKTIEGAFCPANVMRTEVEICGHPLDDDGNCANASAHLS